MSEAPEGSNLLVWFLDDFREFLGLMVNMLGDDDFANEMFGFTIDVGVISRLESVEENIAEVSTGRADLVDLAELTGRLADVTEAGQLLLQALETNPSVDVAAEEILGQFFDTVALAHLSARHPWLLHLARLLGLLTDNLPRGRVNAGIEGANIGYWRVLWTSSNMEFVPVVIDALESLGADLETEEQARRFSVLLAVPTLLLALYRPLVNTKSALGVDPRSFQVVYGWEPDPASTTPIADRISRRFVTVMYRVVDQATEVGKAEVSFEVTVTMAWVLKDQGGPGLYISLGGGGALDVLLGGGWHLVIDEELASGIEMLIVDGPERFFRIGSSAGGGSAELRLERRDEGSQASTADVWRIGSVLEARTVELSLRLSDQDPMLGLVLRIRDAALALTRARAGFLRSVLPSGGLRVGFDLGLLLDTSGGLRLEGGSGLTVQLPVRTSSPHVQGLHLFLALRKGEHDGDPFAFEVSTGLGLKLGCFSILIDRLGIVLPRAAHALDAMPWMRFPDAIGLGIDGGDTVKGGGFLRFDAEKGRYAGALTLTIARFSVNGFGLITDLESGGYSLLVVFSLKAKPPLAAGPWELHGIGGIVGHNHGTDVRALQAAVRTGAVRTMMFPEDPVSAAPRVLATLGDVFPIVNGGSLIGFGIEGGYSAGRLSAVVVVIVESGPASRLLVLVSFLASAPSKKLDIIHVQVDFVGVYDNGRKSLEVDGSLVESRIGPFTLTGDAILRSRAARDPGPGREPTEDDEGVLLLAVGGFHPGFTPPTSVFIPPQRRILLALPMENPRLRLELYSAMTSNSVQLGAKLEVSARKAGLTAEAILGFDALISLDPFRLSVEIDARAAIKRGGTTLAGVGLHLLVDGPSPWHISGTATLSLLFFSIPIPIETTFGSASSQESPPVVDPASDLQAAFAAAAAWGATSPAGAAALVSVKNPSIAADELAAHPMGTLTAHQDVLPLGIELTHIGPARTNAVRFDVGTVTVNGGKVVKQDARGHFAAGEFVDLSDDEKLSRPAFERFVTGFTVGSDDMVAGSDIAADLAYEEILLGPDGAVEEPPRRGRPPLLSVVAHAAAFGPAAVTELRRDDEPRRLRSIAELRVESITHLVASAQTLVALADVPAAGSVTEARQTLAATSAGRSGRAVVVAAYDAGRD